MIKTQWLKYRVSIWVAIAAVVIVAVLLVTKKSPKTLTHHEKSINVTAVQADRQYYAPYLELLGVVKSAEESQLSIPVNAFVKQVLVKEGQSVDQGQVLLEFDATKINYQLSAQQAEIKRLQAEIATEKLRAHHESQEFRAQKALLVLKEKEYSREKRLLKQHASSQAGLDRSQEKVVSQKIKAGNLEFKVKNHQFRLQALTEKLNAAFAKRDELASDLNRLKVRAPFNAIITRRWVFSGERVAAGKKVISLYNKDVMEIIAKLPERYNHIVRNALAKQEFLTAFIAGFDDDSFILKRMGSQVHTGEVGQRVYFVKEDKQAKTVPLMQNEHVHVQVRLPKVFAIAVPAAAVYRQNTVYLINQDQRLVAIKIKRLGQWQDTKGQRYLLINSSGIKDNNQILTQHLPNARQGLKVNVVP